MSQRRIKGVCIGAGYFSHFQYEAWQRIPEVDLIAFSNRDQARARQVMEKFGFRRCRRYRKMFGRKARLLYVITSATVSPGDLRRCGKAGIHHLSETLRPSLELAEHSWQTPPHRTALLVHDTSGFSRARYQAPAEPVAIGAGFFARFSSRMGDGWFQTLCPASLPSGYPLLLVYENGVHFIDVSFFAGEVRGDSWPSAAQSGIGGKLGLIVFEFHNGAIGIGLKCFMKARRQSRTLRGSCRGGG